MKISPAQIKLLRNIEATEAEKKALDYPVDRAIDPNYEPTEGAIAYVCTDWETRSLRPLFRAGLIRCAVSKATGKNLPMQLLTEDGKEFLKNL